MKTFKKVISIIITVITVFSCVSTVSFAGNSTVYGIGTKYGQDNDYFVVSCKDKNSHTLNFKCDEKGTLTSSSAINPVSLYGYYEILVYGKQSNGKFKLIDGTKQNIKGVSSAKIKLPGGYKVYQVKVWHWNTKTIVNNLSANTLSKASLGIDAYWSKVPVYSISVPLFGGCTID